MKNLKYLIIVLLALPLASCEEFLDVKPKDSVADSKTIFDKLSAETALNGTYRQLGSASYYGEGYVTLGYFPSGDIQNATTGGADNLTRINFRSDQNFGGPWSAIYTTINQANNVIANVPLVQDVQLTQQLKNQIVAEAKFIRALAYFDLARGWGGVQLYLEPTTTLSSKTSIPKSSLEETYAQVLKDLTEAEAVLPETVNRIRATKNTARALRARLHLYKKEWEKAIEYSSLLIESTQNYQLVKPYSAWFANGVVGTKESIFELQFSAQNPSALRAQMQHPTRGGTYRYFPNNRFVNLLKDPLVSGGRRALIDSVTQGGQTLWFGNLYYRNPATDPSYILRIAEQYLIRAEARAHIGDLEGAVEDLNAVRERAEIPLLTLGVEVNDAEEILLAIENERRLEFAFEAHRWFDLARTGRAKEVLETLDPTIKVNPWNYLFPIPDDQVRLDDLLEQNPGY